MTLTETVHAANTAIATGDFKAAVPLLDRANIMANDAGMHAIAHDLFNAYVAAKVRAYG